MFVFLTFCCASSATFPVVLPLRKLCLQPQGEHVILKPCNSSNPAQQWAWLGGARLIHAQSSRCLGVDLGSRLPLDARLAKLSDCGEAPAWRCNNTNGALGLAEARLYRKTQGSRLVAGRGVQTSGWRKYDVDSVGNQLMALLCPETGERRSDRKDNSSDDFQTSSFTEQHELHANKLACAHRHVPSTTCQHQPVPAGRQLGQQEVGVTENMADTQTGTSLLTLLLVKTRQPCSSCFSRHTESMCQTFVWRLFGLAHIWHTFLFFKNFHFILFYPEAMLFNDSDSALCKNCQLAC